jgi:hypothetical protein
MSFCSNHTAITDHVWSVIALILHIILVGWKWPQARLCNVYTCVLTSTRTGTTTTTNTRVNDCGQEESGRQSATAGVSKHNKRGRAGGRRTAAGQVLIPCNRRHVRNVCRIRSPQISRTRSSVYPETAVEWTLLTFSFLSQSSPHPADNQ